jgi:flagellar motility protein MotE (MotC chaperone)
MEDILKALIPVICSIIIAVGGLIVAFLEKQKRKLLEEKHNDVCKQQEDIKSALQQERNGSRKEFLTKLSEINQKLDNLEKKIHLK